MSSNTSISNASVKLKCDDEWINSISPELRYLPNISPGGKVSSSLFAVKIIDSLFHGFFNFKVEISIDGYVYWTDSLKIITGIKEGLQQTMFNLEQNYPNPFNSSTTIPWQLARSSRATLKVFDLLGREVANPVDEQRPAGKYEAEFNAATLPKGVYFYQLKAGEFKQTRKMVLLK
jgi:hypothetical protein